MTNTHNKTLNLVAEHFGLGVVDEEDDLVHDLNGDALDIIELVMTLEEQFNISISDEEAEHIRFVKDVLNCVTSKTLSLSN